MKTVVNNVKVLEKFDLLVAHKYGLAPYHVEVEAADETAARALFCREYPEAVIAVCRAGDQELAERTFSPAVPETALYNTKPLCAVYLMHQKTKRMFRIEMRADNRAEAIEIAQKRFPDFKIVDKVAAWHANFEAYIALPEDDRPFRVELNAKTKEQVRKEIIFKLLPEYEVRFIKPIN